jgi:hypothetical protein
MSAAPFDWSGYLTLADDLARRNDEASHRSAISRAYYFVYNIALIRAKRNKFQFIPGESKHVQLWRLYTTSPDPDTLRLGAIAARLKETRERADYEALFVRIGEVVPTVISDAKDFAARLDRLPDRFPNPASIRK